MELYWIFYNSKASHVRNAWKNYFLAAIAALYVAMSVGRPVRRSVRVNEFQEVLIALKVHVLIMFECIMQ
jgi:hypothetical protein